MSRTVAVRRAGVKRIEREPCEDKVTAHQRKWRTDKRPFTLLYRGTKTEVIVRISCGGSAARSPSWQAESITYRTL